MFSAAVFFVLLLSATAQQEPAAIVVRPPADSTAIATQTVKFTCVAYGSPTPNIVQWTTASGKDLNVVSVDPSSSVRITQEIVIANGVAMRVSVLELCNVNTTFTDTYTCAVDNGVSGTGVAPSWAAFTLTVTQPATAPPTIVLGPPANNAVNEGESIQITCVAYGSPVPSIYWARPGCLRMNNNTNNVYIFSEMISVSNVTMRQSTLQICSASVDDSLQYSCWADNGISGTGLGDSSFDFNIRVAPRTTDSSATSTPETQFQIVDEGLPYLIIMVILVMVVIVLLVALVILGIYVVKQKQRLQPKSNYSVTMGAINPGTDEYQITTPDDQQLIEDVEKHDLALEAEDVGTDIQ